MFRNQLTVFEKLEEIGIRVPETDRFYDYFCCFDFEAILGNEDLPGNGAKLSYDAKHTALSVAIASNIPGRKKGVCFVSEGNETDLVERLLTYLETLADEAYLLLQQKYSYVFDALESSQHFRKNNILQEFEAYCKELVVLGFNSGSYDLNLVKPILIAHLLDKIVFVIKPANNYLCIKTQKLRFLDIKNYLAPGFSYKNFLIAYGSSAKKIFFSYEFVTDADAGTDGRTWGCPGKTGT